MSSRSSEYQNFFNDLLQAFQQAIYYTAPINKYYAIGNNNFLLQFAGSKLVPLLSPALTHLSIAPTDQLKFKIYLWDSDSTGIKIPAPPWNNEDYLARGEIRNGADNNIQIYFNLASGILNIIDLANSTAIFWINNVKNIPYYEMGAPLIHIFHRLLTKLDLQIIHSAALGFAQGGILLAGKGGSGKSSSALRCLTTSLNYASDDYCLISNQPAPTAYSLYCSAKVDDKALQTFNYLKSNIINNDSPDEKSVLILYPQYQNRLIKSFPIKAILLPQVVDRDRTSVEATNAATALRALAPSTILQLAGNEKIAFSNIANLVKQVPCYHLYLGRDLDQIGTFINNFCESLL